MYKLHPTSDPVPRSIPAKYRKHIEHWSDERKYGGNYFVTLAGLCIDGPGKGDGSTCQHMFGEDTIKDVIHTISYAQPCVCWVCESCKGVL